MRRRRGLVVAAAVLGSGFWAAQASAYVYWSNFGGGGGTTVGRANLDGAAPVNQSFVTGASGPLGVAVSGQYIYWTNIGGTIGRANLDGSGTPNQSFITGASTPEGVAVNGQYVYWTNVGTNTIGRANLDGSASNQSFISGANGPTGVAANGQYLYWSNFGSSTIGRANLDGTTPNQSFITGASNAGGVAVNSQYIYWSNSATNTIARANLDGTGTPNLSLITGANNPRAVAVDGRYIYWANLGGTTIGRANLDGTGSPNQSFITSAGNSFGVSVDAGPAGAATPSAPSMSFASQPLYTYSAPQTLTITDSGHGALQIGRAQVTTGQTDDFLITTDTCSGATLWTGDTCTIDVRFGPTATSAANGRSATLAVASNDPASPLSITLQGTGGALPQGLTGTNGANGAQGRNGSVELVSCRTVKRSVVKTIHGKRKKVKVTKQACTTKSVTGPVKFTTAALGRAVLSRGGVIYATGIAARRAKHPQLVLNTTRTLRAGLYTLTLRWRSGRTSHVTRQTIMLR